MLVILLFLTCCMSRNSLYGQLPAGIDYYIDTVLKTFEVPGISIAVVQNETFKVVFKNAALKADAYIYFNLAQDGKPVSFRLKVIDPSSDISFDGLEFKR